MKLRVRELEKKLGRLGGGMSETATSSKEDGQQVNNEEINKDLNSDKVIRNLNALIKRVKKEKEDAKEQKKKIKKEMKIVTQEIESYNKQLAGADQKDKEGELIDASLMKANNALKSVVHQKLLVRERERFALQKQLEDARKTVEDKSESKKVYKGVMAERRKNLINKYLNAYQGHDDLEKLLETLYSHFRLVKLTFFEELSQDNPE